MIDGACTIIDHSKYNLTLLIYVAIDFLHAVSIGPDTSVDIKLTSVIQKAQLDMQIKQAQAQNDASGKAAKVQTDASVQAAKVQANAALKAQEMQLEKQLDYARLMQGQKGPGLTDIREQSV